MIPEDERHELHESLRHHLGDANAAVVMTWLFAVDPERVATKEDLAEVRSELRAEIVQVRAEIAQVRLDAARQTRQLTLTILGAFLAQFAGTSAVIVSVV